jgi:hypothetical protein
VISISYLGLMREQQPRQDGDAGWHDWYDYFPWEDHRGGAPAIIAKLMVPQLRAWVKGIKDPIRKRELTERVAVSFGLDGAPWNEELILQRYELTYEAGLIAEAARAGAKPDTVIPGRPMSADHRRILATGIARLRAKIKYRPVVFELMPPSFTLLQLQRTVEALAGHLVHKPNFRRLIEQNELVEETGATTSETGGRPAKLYRFRRAILAERAVIGTKLPIART